MAVLASALAATGSFAGEPADVVREAATATYIHGMTAEIAAEVGPEGVPRLLELLEDPSFPRRDNVVAFLAFLGDGRATAALEAHLARPPARLEAPEEHRAMLLVPQALGQIATRGDDRALDLLLELTDPASGNDLLARAAAHDRDPARMEAELFRMALRGLAHVDAPEAETRLLALARGEVEGAAEATEDARDALDLRTELGAPSAPHPATGGTGPESSTVTAGSLDPASHVDDAGLSYANHPDVLDPMDDARLDVVLGEASLRAGRGDDAADVACCVTVSREGSAATFGSPGDGLDIIDDATERNAALDDRSGRVKVVRAIHYCSGPGTNIIGCAWSPGFGMLVVRMSDVDDEAILWLHEYGHNTGLSHNTSGSRYIMYGTNYGTNDLLSQAECDTFHAPHAWAETTTAQTAACTDDDGDLVQDGIDNCPTVANGEQADADGDGTGDLCESGSGTCGDGTADPGEDCDGGDLAGGSCASLGYHDGDLACTGTCTYDASACSCMDVDGDLWADGSAPLGGCSLDCDDADGLVWDTPGEARAVGFEADRVTLVWTPPADPGATAEASRYDLLRSTDPSDFDGAATCVESDDGTDTRAIDPDVPGPGQAFFYVVRAENDCPSGAGTLGQSRGGRTCGN